MAVLVLRIDLDIELVEARERRRLLAVHRVDPRETLVCRGEGAEVGVVELMELLEARAMLLRVLLERVDEGTRQVERVAGVRQHLAHAHHLQRGR